MKKFKLSLLILVGLLTWSHSARAEKCHMSFSDKAAANRAREQVLQELDANKYKIAVKPFQDFKKSNHWYLLAQPADAAVQARVEDKSRVLGATLRCDYEFPELLRKPVIYLYPPRPLKVLVQLRLQGDLLVSYPDYDESIHGWRVMAYPDGSLIDQADGEKYSSLFWEGRNLGTAFDLSSGFVVPGSQTKDFLRSVLKEMGLTPKEYNEFIVYWLPLMQGNCYNLIHFAGEEYARTAALDITPKPDALLRVFMVFRPLAKPISVPEQKIMPFKRDPREFSVVEWGGAELEGSLSQDSLRSCFPE